jgi:hypothetical protein
MKGLAHVLTVPPVTTHTLSCNLPGILWVRRFRNEGRSKLRQARCAVPVQPRRVHGTVCKTRHWIVANPRPALEPAAA